MKDKTEFMAKRKEAKMPLSADEANERVRKNLPPGVKLLRTLRGHTDAIGRIAWSPDGQILASPSKDKTIRIWDAVTGECARTLTGHNGSVFCAAVDPVDSTLATGGEPMRAFVVAAEGDLIGKRMIGTEAKKESVLPVLLDGTDESAFPPLLHGRVYADFRSTEGYFGAALTLLLSLYEIKPQDPVAVDLRESLGGGQAVMCVLGRTTVRRSVSLLRRELDHRGRSA